LASAGCEGRAHADETNSQKTQGAATRIVDHFPPPFHCKFQHSRLEEINSHRASSVASRASGALSAHGESHSSTPITLRECGTAASFPLSALIAWCLPFWGPPHGFGECAWNADIPGEPLRCHFVPPYGGTSADPANMAERYGPETPVRGGRPYLSITRHICMISASLVNSGYPKTERIGLFVDIFGESGNECNSKGNRSWFVEAMRRFVKAELNALISPCRNRRSFESMGLEENQRVQSRRRLIADRFLRRFAYA